MAISVTKIRNFKGSLKALKIYYKNKKSITFHNVGHHKNSESDFIMDY